MTRHGSQRSRPPVRHVALGAAVAMSWALFAAGAHRIIREMLTRSELLPSIWTLFAVSSTLALLPLSCWFLSPQRRCRGWLFAIGVALLPLGAILAPGVFYLRDGPWGSGIRGWGAVLSLGGGAVWTCIALWQFLGTGHLDRPACRHCSYDMTDATGLTCPECGHAARSLNELHRGGRPKWLGRAALLITLLMIPATRIDAVRSRGAAGTLPTSLFVVLYPVIPEVAFGSTPTSPFGPMRFHLDRLTSWQESVLVHWARADHDRTTDLRKLLRARWIGNDLRVPELYTLPDHARLDLMEQFVTTDDPDRLRQLVIAQLWFRTEGFEDIVAVHRDALADRLGTEADAQTPTVWMLATQPDEVFVDLVWPRLQFIDDSQVRWTVVTAVAKTCSRTDMVLKRIPEGLDHPSPHHRAIAAGILLHVVDSDEFPALGAQLASRIEELLWTETDLDTRLAAVELLAAVGGDVPTDEALLRRLDSDDPAQLAQACRIIAVLQETAMSHELFVRLHGLASHPVRSVSEAAREALVIRKGW